MPHIGSSIVVEQDNYKELTTPKTVRENHFKIQSRNSIGAVENPKTSLMYD